MVAILSFRIGLEFEIIDAKPLKQLIARRCCSRDISLLFVFTHYLSNCLPLTYTEACLALGLSSSTASRIFCFFKSTCTIIASKDPYSTR